MSEEVSQTTAQLLVEAGCGHVAYDRWMQSFLTENGAREWINGNPTPPEYKVIKSEIIYNPTSNSLKYDARVHVKYVYDPPTFDLVEQWLWAERKMHINVHHKPWNQTFGYTVTGSWNDKTHGVIIPYGFANYATKLEALEDAIVKICNNIIDSKYE